MRRAAACFVSALFVALPVSAARHVRVVLDLSISMQANDPGRLALLSTMLLHDLAQPNPSMGDSFAVIPFDLNWDWQPRGTPPVSTQAPIKAQLGKRAEFMRAIGGLPYAARKTYFYPGIVAALNDLKQTGAASPDTRAIVLVTDGVPESPTRDEELQRIRDEVAPQLEQTGIRLYVLAFGGEADRNHQFFDAMVRSPRGASLGEYFVDPNGARLLQYMQDIFSRSFGFSPDSAHSLPGTSSLDLQNKTTPDRVAVTVFSSRSQPPQLHLVPPSGGSVNAPDRVLAEGVAGGSYSLEWVLAPNQGDYGIASDVAAGSVAVLRPTRLVLEIEPVPPHKQAERALAGVPFPMRVIVRSPTGAAGDPGSIDLSFRTFGGRVSQPAAGAAMYEWESERGSPAASSSVRASKGRAYDIVVDFREDPKNPSKPYDGYLEVEARRGEAVVGSLTGLHAHQVEVHPLLAISPHPLGSYLSGRALERGQQACTQIAFRLDAGQLPHPDRPQYSIRAVLIASDPLVLDRELRQASLTLDSLPLDFEGKPSQQPGMWFKGRQLSGTGLLGNHDLCIQIGKPSSADPAHPVELSLVTTLLEDPYDDFKVIQPFSGKVLVSPPTLLEKYHAAAATGAAMLLIFALLWYQRDRPQFPSDLGYSVSREDSTMQPAWCALEERSGFAKLFALSGDSPIVAEGEDRALGRVRPVRKDLYQIRTAPGVRVQPFGREETIPLRGRLATISVQRPYRLQSERATYVFQMEYR